MVKKSLTKFLQQIDNKKGVLRDTKRHRLAEGIFKYSRQSGQLAINEVVIPIGAIRNQIRDFYGHGPILWVDARYNLGAKIALQEYQKMYSAEVDRAIEEEYSHRGLGGGTGTGH